jgi:hypothetical protein
VLDLSASADVADLAIAPRRGQQYCDGLLSRIIGCLRDSTMRDHPRLMAIRGTIPEQWCDIQQVYPLRPGGAAGAAISGQPARNGRAGATGGHHTLRGLDAG